MSFLSFADSGFHITLSNGWTISVQFGPNTMSEKKSDSSYPMHQFHWDSPDAEIAIWDCQHEMCEPEGYRSPDQFAALLATLAADPAPYYFGA